MGANPVFSAIVPEVLIEENYATWSVCIKTYLLSQDLWDIIEREPTSIENISEFDRRKKNAMALHAIQISCGSKLLYQIMECVTAKEAWDFLAKKCSPQIQRIASSSISKEIELDGQASHRFNPALRREDWLKSIEVNARAKEKARTNQSQSLMRIRKVPPMLREKFKTCFEPSVVSIGPYHHNCDSRLQEVEKLKPLIAKQFVDRHAKKFVDQDGRMDVRIFFGKFEEKFNKIRDHSINGFYDENVTKDEEFKRMMFLDGCFILYFIICIHSYGVESMGLKNHQIASVQQDLFLLENQLPFQVLEMLMSLSDLSSGYRMHMLEEFTEDMNTCGLPIWMRHRQVRIERVRNQVSTEDMNSCGLPIWMIYPQVRIEEPLHLLDFLWKKLLGNNEEFIIGVGQHHENKDHIKRQHHENKDHIKRHLFHGVKELTAAGIHLRPNSSGSLRDIKFRSHCIYGTLTLPRMTIERSTRQMFLNLIAHEACMDSHRKFGFTSYICFLDLLIDLAEDVKALRTAGILVNYLESDEEVAKLFNEIASDLLPEIDTYKEVKFKIQHYLGARPKVKMASWGVEVIHEHFKSPWTIIALLAGIIVISLSFVQTYFTIFPRSK